MDAKVTINYPCSKCDAPIQLDAGFSHPSEHTKAELGLPVFRGSQFELPSEDEADEFCIDKMLLPLILSADSMPSANSMHNITGLNMEQLSVAMYGYTVLGCPNTNTTERTPALKVTSELLDMASSNSSIDHPLCEECTETLLQHVEGQLNFTAAKAASYSKLVEELERMPLPSTQHLEKQLKELEEEARELETTVARVVEEQRVTAQELKEKRSQAQALADEELRYQVAYCKQRSLWLDADEERVSFHNQKVHSQHQLEKLKQTNIFNIAFHIWKDDHISTINNFRLGRTPTMQVSWQEINAALGQMALLLVSLTRKFNLNFSKHKIVPYGNHSYIEVLKNNVVLPLYTHTSLKAYFDHSFDLAMVAFLECFVELVRYLEQGTNNVLSLPYPIVKHNLEDPQAGTKYSIKRQFNPDEQWTKALKFLLTNLKWALTWVSAPTLSQLQAPHGSSMMSQQPEGPHLGGSIMSLQPQQSTSGRSAAADVNVRQSLPRQ